MLSIPGVDPRPDPRVQQILDLLKTPPAPAPPDCNGTGDAGNNAANATPESAPARCSGSLGGNDRLDVYAIDESAEILLSASMTPSENASFVLCLATPEALIASCAQNGTGQPAATSLVTNETGAWLVALFTFGDVGTYVLSIDATAAPPRAADCPGADAADAPTAAAPLAWPGSCDGRGRFLDDIKDWYALTDGSLIVNGTADRPVITCLYLAEDPTAPISCGSLSPTGSAAAYANDPGHGGYLLLVFSPGDSSYHLDVADAPPQNDCGAGFDAPASVAHPIDLGAPRACDGLLDASDTADVFRVHVPAGQAMSIQATFVGPADGMVCVIPSPSPSPSPSSCEIAWAGGSGIALGAAPAGEERDVLVAIVSDGASSYHFETDLHAPSAQDDCGSGTDAPGALFQGQNESLPLDCDGAIVARDGDVWDLYRVPFTDGPVYADITPDAGLDADLCIVSADFEDGLCSANDGQGAPEDLASGWIGNGGYVAVVRYSGSGSYHLHVEQQDDCGTRADAGTTPGSKLASSIVRCDALLDPFLGDDEDAYIVPPPAIPDVVVVRVEPQDFRIQLCVDDPAQGHCTGSTFTRVLVARDPLRTMRVTVTTLGVDPLPYTLIVENAAQHPPPIPPLL